MPLLTSQQLRERFLEFFKQRGHTIVPSCSLLPSDPSVLFTSAGMQPFKEYYTGKASPYGNRVCSIQKCFRTSDIDEVGDSTHLTFLEMLGNFSFGDYFKKEAIELAWKFLTGPSLRLAPERFWVTVFEGEGEIPRDEESAEIWHKRLGIDQEKIHQFGRADNFWGPTGKEGPCGPTTEIHYDLTARPCSKRKKCRPNCECGRFLELWNLVFNEYYQDEQGKLSLLEQKGVDTGMGLERLAMVVQAKASVFETDLFEPMVNELNSKLQRKTQNLERAKRIIADHTRGSVFLSAEGVFPANTEQGYVLRRLLRRAIRLGKLSGLEDGFLLPLAQRVIELYRETYPELGNRQSDILTILQKEEEKFAKTLARGLKQFEKVAAQGEIKGEEAFHLYDTYGFPIELTRELAKEKRVRVEEKGFQEALERHQAVSRAGALKKFGGLGIDQLKGKREKLKVIKLHTATHLLHQALREVLGKHVRQMGSDITAERLRFDFIHPQKMTPEEIGRVEALVNQKIKEGLAVRRDEMSYEEAIRAGALAFFKEKYPERVSVYSIGPLANAGQVFSKEICAGPHVRRTSALGRFKIIKEESSGAGIRRVRAVLA